MEGSRWMFNSYPQDIRMWLREKGGIVKSIVYPGVGHGWIAGALSWINFCGPPVLDDMMGFFDSIARADN